MATVSYHDCVPEGNTGAVLLLAEEDDIAANGSIRFNGIILLIWVLCFANTVSKALNRVVYLQSVTFCILSQVTTSEEKNLSEPLS